MASESVIFTALPNGLRDGGRVLQVTVFVSPRLSTDGVGLLPLKTGGFAAFADWPAALTNVKFAVTVDGVGTFDAQHDPTSPVPESTTWHLLFDGCSVRDGTFTDLSERRVLSFPVAAMSQAVLGLYKEIAEGFPSSFPPVRTGPLVHLGRNLGQLGQFKNEFYPTLDNLIAQEHGPNGKAGRYLDRSLISSGNRDVMAFAEAYRFYDRPGARDPGGPGAAPTPPKPPDIDFHGAVATLGDYPELLGRIGLAIDLLVKRDPAVPALGRIRVAVTAPPGFAPWMTAEAARPWTRYEIAERRFVPQPRDKEGDLVDGTLRLENRGAFIVNQVDIDGSAMKTVDFAGNLARIHQHLSQQTVSMVEDASSLPALRTGGFTISRDGRAARLVGHLDNAADHESDHSTGTATELFAEDVTRGYRVDVEDSKHPNRWRSLHKRTGTYRIVPSGNAPVDLPIGPDEGFVKGASTSSVPGHEQDLYLHEAMFGWEGWSLAAKRPGQTITNEGAETIPDKNVTDIPLFTKFEATKGTLPRLRFGRRYRFRARTVDLAGNSVREEALNPQHVSPAHDFLRFEPVPSPTVVPRRRFTEGESLLRMVIRSTLGILPTAYVGLSRIVALAGHTDPGTAYLAVNERHLAPPISSQQLAEWHGRFDAAFGESASQAALDAQFDIAARESGSFLQPGPNVFVVNPDPTKTPTDLADPSRKKGDPLQQGEYVCHDVDDLALPYLPDPLSLGASLTALPGDAGTRLLKWEGGPQWFDRRPFRLRIEDGSGAPVYDAAKRLLTVFLAQAEMVTVRLSSFVDPAELPLMAIWMLELSTIRTNQQAAADRGLHWMLTPWQPLALVHAVEKPLTAPGINVPASGVPQSGVQRNVGETFAVLAGTIANHAKSTGRLDVEARWTEPIDDLAQDAPSEIDGRTHVGDFLLAASEEACRIGRDDQAASGLNPPVHKLRHEFRDTKHRWVHYHAIATTRFREYFPPEITNDPTLVTHQGAEVLLDVPSSRRPEPPEVLYVIPTWTWSERPLRAPSLPGGPRLPATTLRSRSGGGLRVYLDRPWYSSGADELLGVVLEDQPWFTWPFDVAAGLVGTVVSKAIADEFAENILAAGLIKGVGPSTAPASERLLNGIAQIRDVEGEQEARERLQRATDRVERALAAHAAAERAPGTSAAGRAVAQFSAAQLSVVEQAIAAFLLPKGDPQQFVTQWGVDPIWGSAPVHAGPYIHQFPLRVAVGYGISLSEAPGHTVTVVGHQPKFDPARKLWYCDLQLEAGRSYFPFVRLALARYQPHSIAGQHLSKVVFPDFAQLVAERTLAVTRIGRSLAAVTLRGPGGYTRTAEELLSLIGGTEQLLSLSRFAVVQIERLPVGARTDLAWAPVGDEIRLTLAATSGLSDIRYSGRVTIPAKGEGEQLRLAVREYEIFQTDESEKDDEITRPLLPFEGFLIRRPIKYRLVYADQFPL